jgi:hypothetical protein
MPKIQSWMNSYSQGLCGAWQIGDEIHKDNIFDSYLTSAVLRIRIRIIFQDLDPFPGFLGSES